MKHTVREIKLSNGVSGLLIDVPQAQVMSYDFTVRAGDFLAPENKWETPHVMEHLLCGANQKFRKARTFEAEVKKNGAYSNAYTNMYNVGYVGECADFEWDRILSLLMLSISKPLFLQEEFTAEVGSVKEELSGHLSNYFRQLSLALYERAGFLVTSDRSRLGKLNNVTIDDVRAHYKRTHNLSNICFVVAGDFQGRRDKFVNIIEKNLELPEGSQISLPETKLSHHDEPLYIENKTVESLYVSFTMMLPRRISEPEIDALNALNNILTATTDSLILGDIREKGLAYYIFSGGNRGHDYSIWDFDFQVSPENAKEALGVIVKHLKTVLKGNLKPEKLKASKEYALGSFQMGAQTVGSILHGYSYEYSITGEVMDYKRIPERIKGVTMNRVTSIAQEFHKEALWDFGVLGSCGQKLVDELHEELAKLWS
ncbi:insulinase family protein [Candidatus Nomurabacteria bacterium]|nr:insulinase family protein [Candidatus Nomurabacteria bacterium]